jgi:hypothetical protein
MATEETALASLLLGLAMPELGATRENILDMAARALDAYLSGQPDETKRALAVALREALDRWTSSAPTAEIIAAAKALLTAEGHGDAPAKVARGAAWVQVITLVHDLAHPETKRTTPAMAGAILAKLDAYLAVITEQPQRDAALALRAALAAWTSPAQPDAVTEAARAMLAVEEYDTFRAELRGMCSS